MILDLLRKWFAADPRDDAKPKFKAEWIAYLESNLPIYGRLPHELCERLHQKIAWFVREVWFEGCGGLELDDEMILTVAGQACLLVMNMDGPPYPRLNTVLLYPSTYKSVVNSPGPGGVVIQREVTRLGESWPRGTVILAWDATVRGARNIFDGRNLVFHEFAHQLDQADGRGDGTPSSGLTRKELVVWEAQLGESFNELTRRAATGKKSAFSHYGTTNPAEFFAVATEAFFEKPRQIRKKHPEVYALLSDYFQLDPESWYFPSRSTK